MIVLSKEVKERAKKESRFTIQFRLDGRNVPTMNVRDEPSFHSCIEFSSDLSKEEGEAFIEMWLSWLNRAKEDCTSVAREETKPDPVEWR